MARFVLCFAMIVVANVGEAQLTLTGGLQLVEEGPAGPISDPAPPNLAAGATPFASSDLGPILGIDFHLAANLNDGLYGNPNAWIGGDALPGFAGISLGATPVTDVQSIAFGRANVTSGGTCGGVCTDRWPGLYTLQYTAVPSPGALLADTGNPATGWATIGTLDYVGPIANSNFQRPWERHRYNFDPVAATGVRLLVPGSGLASGTAIDEIELYDQPGAEPIPFAFIEAAPGYTITWDEIEGAHFDPGAPPTGALVPDNAALASNGSTAFSSSDLGPQLGVAFHVAANLNDGFYGHVNAWIGGDQNPFPVAFGGVAFARQIHVHAVAWSRDNGNSTSDACGGLCTDRTLGEYELQRTTVPAPSATTPDTGDAATGWESVGSFDYEKLADDGGLPWLRHQYALRRNQQPVPATGIRLVVPGTGIGGGTAVDEIEAYVPEPACGASWALAVLALLRARRRPFTFAAV